MDWTVNFDDQLIDLPCKHFDITSNLSLVIVSSTIEGVHIFDYPFDYLD